MDTVNNTLLKMYVAVTAPRSSEDGQGALEYMAMVVAMVVLIFLGFRIAGADIQEEASNFVSRVLNGRSNP